MALANETLNTLETATIMQTELDQALIPLMVTGWMESNAGQVQYNGGDEVKIPTLETQGMKDYDRDSGYQTGSVNLKYQTLQMTQDRGRQFFLDAVSVNETNFIANATAVMNDFQSNWVAKELDQYRISKLVQDAIAHADATKLKYGYTPAAETILAELLAAINILKKEGRTNLVAHVTYDVLLALETMAISKTQTMLFEAGGGISMEVTSVGGVPLIATPDHVMHSEFVKNAGAAGGLTPAGNAINFVIVDRTVPLAITKQDVVRIFDPLTTQDKNAWKIDYRRFHDLWTKENQRTAIYVNMQGAAPVALAAEAAEAPAARRK